MAREYKVPRKERVPIDTSIMKRYRLLLVCAIGPLMAMLVSCETPNSQGQSDPPKQATAWTGRPGNLSQWGHGADHVYGLLWMPDSKKNMLVLWKWRGDMMKEAATVVLPRSTDVVPVSETMCGLSLRRGDNDTPWPFALADMSDGVRIVRKWDRPKGWSFRLSGASLNGKFIALLVCDGVDAPGYEFLKPRAKIALIEVSKRELRWVGELPGHGADTVRRVAVSDDGRYIAVAGWNNGTAMVDAKEAKVLWAKSPKDEVSTGYAVFVPDGEVIYTVGSAGCVYGIDVATGDVVSQRWATTTGKSIYGHRGSSLALSSDGNWLAAGTGPEGQVYVWDLKGNSTPRMLNHGLGTVMIVAFSPDAKNIASVGGGVLKVWGIEGDAPVADGE